MICVRSLALLENHIAYLRASVRIHAQRFLSNPAPLRLLAFVFFPQHFSPSHPACPGSPLIQAKGFSFYCSRPLLWVVPQCPSNVSCFSSLLLCPSAASLLAATSLLVFGYAVSAPLCLLGAVSSFLNTFMLLLNTSFFPCIWHVPSSLCISSSRLIWHRQKVLLNHSARTIMCNPKVNKRATPHLYFGSIGGILFLF